jgi:hypothetical protein
VSSTIVIPANASELRVHNRLKNVAFYAPFPDVISKQVIMCDANRLRKFLLSTNVQPDVEFAENEVLVTTHTDTHSIPYYKDKDVNLLPREHQHSKLLASFMLTAEKRRFLTRIAKVKVKRKDRMPLRPEWWFHKTVGDLKVHVWGTFSRWWTTSDSLPLLYSLDEEWRFSLRTEVLLLLPKYGDYRMDVGITEAKDGSRHQTVFFTDSHNQYVWFATVNSSQVVKTRYWLVKEHQGESAVVRKFDELTSKPYLFRHHL